MRKNNNALAVPETRVQLSTRTTDFYYPWPSVRSSVRLADQVMGLWGWTSLSRTITTTAGFLGRSHIHVRWFSRSVLNMAEEAKKLAAYAAVDNHVQVGFEPQWTLAASFTKSPLNKTRMCYISYVLATE